MILMRYLLRAFRIRSIANLGEKSNFVFNYSIRLGRAITLRATLIFAGQDKFVNGDVCIVLSFINMQELMFVNVYMSYKSTIDNLQ